MTKALLSRPLFFVASLCVCSVACDKAAPASEAGSGEAKAAQPEAEAAQPQTKQEASTQEAVKPEPGEQSGKDGQARLTEAKAEAKAKSEELKKSRAELSRLLDDGRKAVKDKRYDEGIALYRQALKIDPVNTKVLGELGFAALRKGDLELAEGMTRRAIDLSSGTKGLGAMYYNLGRIEEDRGKIAEARAAYEQSLAVRPGNEIVAGRLAALELPAAGTSKTTLDSLCAELMAEWSCYASEAEIEKLPEDEQMDAGQCDCTVAEQLREGTGKSFITDAALLALEGMSGYGGGMDDKYLAVNTRGQGWQLVAQVVNGYTPGAFGIFNEGRVEAFEFVELGGAAGEELRVHSHNSGLDSDMGINQLHFDDIEDMVICHDAGGGEGRCGTILVSGRSGTDTLMDDEPVEFPDDIQSSSWAFEVSFEGGKVTIVVKSGQAELGAEVAALAGSRSLEETLALPGARPSKLF